MKKKIRPQKRKAKSPKHKINSSISPQRRRLATKAQAAIDLATQSVNKTLSAAIVAQEKHRKNIFSETATLKEEWQMEREQISKLNAEAEKSKFNLLGMRSKLSSQVSRAIANKKKIEIEERLKNIDEEIKFKSEVFVEHKRILKENEDKRRRLSTEIKAKMHRERREAEKQIHMATIEENHQSLERKWAGEKDAEEYLKQCEQERRDDFAFRNAEGVRQRQEEEERKIAALNAKHESLELKWAGEKDAEEYLKQCEQERRDDFAFRNAEGVRHRKVMDELKSICREKEKESFLLKWAGEEDGKAYLKEQDNLRRKSLQFRNEEGKRHRMIDEEMRYEEIQKKHEEQLLKSACQKDVEEYKAKCEARKRASFCYRRKEAEIQRLEAKKAQIILLEEKREQNLLEAAACKDVENYLEDCKRRRRQSLASRAQEKRRHDAWKKQEAEKKRQKKKKK